MDPVTPGGRRAWLLLIHQIPPSPAYLRVKIGRRLQGVGAVAIKNSVYVLPEDADTREDFEWIAREIREAAGDALVAQAHLVDGLTDAGVRELFHDARDEDYVGLMADGRPFLKALNAKKPPGAAQRRRLEQEVTKLRRRFDALRELDFFRAPKQAVAQEHLEELERRVALLGDSTAVPVELLGAVPHGRTWVTRRGVKVDRMASAWLIRRFIDPLARFRFVNPDEYRHRDGELRFDMVDAEYTHAGDYCTFETLVVRFQLPDPALLQLGEIIHDVDCKDDRFHREEAGGLRRVISGIVATHAGDDARIERGAALFDDLHASFSVSSQAGE